MPVGDDEPSRLARFLQVVGGEPVHARRRVVDHGGKRLVDLVRDRGRHLPQGGHSRDVGQLRLGATQRLFGLLSLDELPDLAAQDGHHGQPVGFGLTYLVAEELHDSQDFAAEHDGKRECGVQPFACGDRRTHKVRVADDIRNVCRLTREPHSPRQPFPGRQRAAAGCRFEFRNLDGFLTPHLHEPQHARLPVDTPQRTQVPHQALAYGPEQLWRRLLESCRLREYLGDHVLRHATLFGPLVLADVLYGTEHAARAPRLVPEHFPLAPHEPHLAVRADDAVLDVVARPAPQRRRHGRHQPRIVRGVKERGNIVERHDAFLRPQPEDAVGLVRPGVTICLEITLPVADMRDSLGVFQPSLALGEVPKDQQAGQGVLQASADLPKEALFLRHPGARVRALVQPQHVGLVALGIDGHGHHGLDAESPGRLRRQRVFRRRPK